MKFEATYHAREERTDRIAAILATTGFGVVVYEQKSFLGHGVEKLTDQGVLVVTDEDGVKLVTAYRCTVSKARAMMGKELPKSLKRTIERNLRMYGT